MPPLRGARATLLAAMVGALTSVPSEWLRVSAAVSPVVEEHQVKAAFLFNIAKFVEWPPAQTGSLVIGIAGDDDLEKAIGRAGQGRSVKGRELVTRRFDRGDDPNTCHLLFISSTWQREAVDILQRARGPVLTVGETVQFLRDGGMVRFYLENSRVRFQISQRNAEAAGLKISSQLLTLAAP